MPNLAELPNELWLIVFSYLDIVDLFRAFHNLNQRFNNLVYNSARHISLPDDTTGAWLEQHIPDLENRIQIICLHEKSMQYVFGNRWSFPNLRLINLQGYEWNMSLRIKENPISFILMSSLNFLHDVGIYTNNLSDYTRNKIINDEAEYYRILSCPFIERLSIGIYSVRSFFLIRTRAPNLLHLKMKYMHSEWYQIGLINKLNLIEQTTRLLTLSITTKTLINLDLLKQFINSYKTSLEKLVLDVDCLESIDGYYLESIFKSCQQLKKLGFIFLSNKIKVDSCLYSFQSEWWLDQHRPAVYIQPTDTNDIIIVSMPCLHSFIFKNGLYNWDINKGDMNSSFVRFNSDKIHFTNKTHQPISLEYLYSIHRIFTSSNQSLYFDFCKLETEGFLFDELMDGMEPILPNVKHFTVSQHTLDSLMLCVWILLMPNLQQLDISKLTTFNQKELVNGLKDRIDNDQRLQPNFDHINELIVFSKSHDIDTKTKEKLLEDLRKIFTKAIIQ